MYSEVFDPKTQEHMLIPRAEIVSKSNILKKKHFKKEIFFFWIGCFGIEDLWVVGNSKMDVTIARDCKIKM